MAINVGPSLRGDDPEVMIDINTTPLIDVMLVLLIMLIITIPIQTHEVKLDMPHANAPPPIVQPVVVELDVDFEGTITRKGEVDRPSLEARFAQAAALPDQPEVHLRPNKLAAYSTVAMVLASAQRIGITKIGLVGNEQFIQN